jgi:hypothetical protein
MLKIFRVFYDDLTPEAKDRLCDCFLTGEKKENWQGPGAQPLAEIHREAEPEQVKMEVTVELTIRRTDRSITPRHVMADLTLDANLMAVDTGDVVSCNVIEFSDDWE